MMKYFVILLLPACLLCAVEDRSSAQENVVAFKVYKVRCKKNFVFKIYEGALAGIFNYVLLEDLPQWARCMRQE